MTLIEIDDVGLQSAERVLDFHDNACFFRIPKWLAILPVEAHLCRNDCTLAAAIHRQCFSDDFLRATETIDGRCVDQSDTAVQCRVDRFDGLAFVAAAPHPPADGPSSQGDARGAD